MGIDEATGTDGVTVRLSCQCRATTMRTVCLSGSESAVLLRLSAVESEEASGDGFVIGSSLSRIRTGREYW